MQGWPQNEDPRAFHRQSDDVVAARLVELFEQFRPQVVVTYFANSGYNHPDHLKAHDVTLAARRGQRHPEPSCISSRARALPRADARDRRGVRHRAAAVPEPQATTPPPVVGEPVPEPPPRPFGVDDSLITTYIDGSTYAKQKRAALAAHASQLEGTFFLQFPDEAFAKAFGSESFIRERDATGAPLPEDDLFAGLR